MLALNSKYNLANCLVTSEKQIFIILQLNLKKNVKVHSGGLV